MANEIIKLNVGGEIYTTTRCTLTKYPQSMLGAMFTNSMSTHQDEHGAYFIDRDKKVFKYILQFLRCGKLILPSNFKNLDLLKTEADFYQVQPLIKALDELATEKIETCQMEGTRQRGLLLFSASGHSLCGQYLNHNCVYIQDASSAYQSNAIQFSSKTIQFKDFKTFLTCSKTWKLVQTNSLNEANARAYMLSLGISYKEIFRNDITYSNVAVEEWRRNDGISIGV